MATMNSMAKKKCLKTLIFQALYTLG